ncbi:MAG: MoxR family ATPase [Thermus sp.]|uniref:AAA family ATPase n=1 Tax=unclassified Thermus TaxID=2619321 RepID=UPI000238931A|nr:MULTISPECIES: MoxR family ATPase [unclassified Thermus]AEV16615.1 ATPase associated with various cellular activities AAA_3 [Thermus sp. CCB_US3_UF1]MCS6869446.1 MoxR family ATPase [Thermus sp.]MCS7218255.1 MoxR family ATPase [Thermus sp.]MCX7849145.1 MoxR family ATPase [Thermus sp.]MDW8016239.1 MoxR family ATPase [Thermus sp.]
MAWDEEPFQEAGEKLRTLLKEVKRVIVGQDHLLERMLVALLARGHLLIEGVPGLAKTLAVKTLAEAVGGSFRRIQFTPDLVPADLLGTRVYNPKEGEFRTELGPIFAHLLLADEINRAPAKVQSALLEAMQERQVTLGRETYPLPKPFLVLATQNPIESEGTYPLPEAQLDRFLLKVVVDYPAFHEELEIVRRMTTGEEIRVEKVLSLEDLLALSRLADQVYVHPKVAEHAVALVQATRDLGRAGLKDLKPYVAYGASPRASLALVGGAKALALLRGRAHALPEDVRDLFPDALRHRLVLSYQALAEGVGPEAVLQAVLDRFPPPFVPLHDPYGDARSPLGPPGA